MDQNEIEGLLRQAVAGCEDSAVRFVQLFETQIRMEIRTRLASAELARVIDSVDIAQSVFTDFLISARTGEIGQQEPRAAIAMLMRTSREKVAQKIRYHQAGKRDWRRNEGTVEQYVQLPSDAPGPREQATESDMLEFLRAKLGETDFRLLQLRIEGCSWGEVSVEVGMSPDACRMRIQRLRSELPREVYSLIH